VSREVGVIQVDAFTRRPFAGNPAAVVLDAAGLAEREMLLIAREMNLSETAFLLPPSDSRADLRLRWFSPGGEVDLCGHATVATFHAALEEGRLAPGSYRLESRSGVLPVEARRGPDGRPRVSLGLPVPAMSTLDPTSAGLSRALGIDAADSEGEPPPMRTGEWALVPVARLETLRHLRPDFRALRSIAADTGMASTIVLTTETIETSSKVHLRMFAPAAGIDEDPVTGSAQGPVAAWLVAHGLAVPAGEAVPARFDYIAEQGDPIGRPGRVAVEVALEAGSIVSITIRGEAVTVLRGSLQLPPVA